MVSVSERAWARAKQVRYAGYDALSPWREAMHQRYMPYTHNWQAMAGLRVALERLQAEGLENVYQRHANVASYCRRRLLDMGIELWPQRVECASPTVTCARLPTGWAWERFNGALRAQGMAVGGNYGPLAGKTFRIGHMGAQADLVLVQQGMDLIEELLGKDGS
jgi:aspartate aminotransferase-like enzyme